MARSKPNLNPAVQTDLPIIVNFSGGRTSAFMAVYLNSRYPDRCINIFCNTGKEQSGTLDFVEQVSGHFNFATTWLEYRSGRQFAIVNRQSACQTGRPFSELIHDRGIPSKMARSCTKELKERTTDRYLQSIGIKPRHRITAIGIRADERHRLGQFFYPLVSDMTVDVHFIRSFWRSQPFDLMIDESLGNCDFCFLKSLRKRIAIAKKYPDLVKWWSDMESKFCGSSDFLFDMHNHVPISSIINQSALAADQLDIEFDCFCSSS